MKKHDHLRAGAVLHVLAIGFLVNAGGCTSVSASGEPGEQDAARIAQELVAKRAGPQTPVTVLSVEPVEFADASLGCPQPGMAYAQVITSGHRVIIQAGDRRYDVRTAGNGGRICDRLPSLQNDD